MGIMLNGKHIKRIHFVGIRGVAMTSLALVSLKRGLRVTGSDVDEPFPTDDVLSKAKISVSGGFSHDNPDVAGSDMVVYTGAHSGRENPEVKAAIARGIPAVAHGQALGMFMDGHRQISVAGCHGKTTVTGMIATIHSKAGTDASYASGCGGICPIGDPGYGGSGEWFIAEADEYVTDPGHDPTPRFMWQHPEVLVVTNIGYDHPDAYPSLEDIRNVFRAFARTVPDKGLVVVNGDDGNSRILTEFPAAQTVGFLKTNTYRIADVATGQEKTEFSLVFGNGKRVHFVLHVPGRHNVTNAAMAAVASVHSGLTWEQAVRGISAYCGSKRRFELIRRVGSVSFYDDYAHHPDEIRATIAAVRSWYPNRRLVVVFEPHTYSRTKALLNEFAAAFSGCDRVIISKIYASARESDNLGISSRDLVEKMKTHIKNVTYASGAGDVSRQLAGELGGNDICIFMGAGDIYAWGRKIAHAFKTGPLERRAE